MLSRVADVEGTIPTRFVRPIAPAPLGFPERLVAGGVALACLSLLLIAVHLTPSPDGLGSHQALGLPACGFLLRFGLPCPSCGMTTAFCWMVRGNVAASFYVQPMGAVLAILCGMTVWASVYIALSGQPAHRLLSFLPAKYHLIPLLGIARAAWGWKMFIHLNGIDGWR
jgi:hypothetical protein